MADWPSSCRRLFVVTALMRFFTNTAPMNRGTTNRNMASAEQSIAADASLLEAGRVMCAAHVHRIPVLDGERVVGIVSTMDIVAAMVNVVDELDTNQPMDF